MHVIYDTTAHKTSEKENVLLFENNKLEQCIHVFARLVLIFYPKIRLSQKRNRTSITRPCVLVVVATQLKNEMISHETSWCKSNNQKN